MPDTPRYDLFLSHGTPDKPWVETLVRELEALDLKVFLDTLEIKAGDNFVLRLSDGLGQSRFLVLVMSSQTFGRPWVDQEWTAFLAEHGPTGRVLPVLIEHAEMPTILKATQYLRATHRDAARVARELAVIAGRPGAPHQVVALPGDRRLPAQALSFVLKRTEETLEVTDPDGRTRTVTPPWISDGARFAVARLGFQGLSRKAIETADEHAEFVRCATAYGELLFAILFDDVGAEVLRQATDTPGYTRALVTIASADDVILSLPWELLSHDGSFLVHDGKVDLVRTIPGAAGPGALVPEPDELFKIVVNVSAPEGSGLDYEGESYRIARALSESCELTPTELGTVEDLLETAEHVRPTGIHFSGHGSPGRLQFEDDEGREHVFPVAELAADLKRRVPGGLPPFFYLASCHGNEPAVPEEGRSGAESSAAHLHRAGVAQVVGYYGPIHDELSTRAEVALYGALAAGETARYALRQAREALRRPFRATGGADHRPGPTAEEAAAPPVSTHPFAWAQLVFYHRGPDRPLCKAEPSATRRAREAVLERTFQGLGRRKVLQTGFVGRRVEFHRVRQRIRRGDKVFVFQGLGGLGKSTLAFRVLPMLGAGEDVAVLWCQETESQPDRAEALVAELLAYCWGRFGAGWEEVVQQVDRVAGDNAAQRFVLFLDAVLQKVPRLVLYLDNLESLLVGPDDPRAAGDEGAMGEWRSAALGAIWQALRELAGQRELMVVASCRYRHPDFAGTLVPVSPLQPDALYRMMRWFPGLRRLSGAARVALVSRLAGHPRAVEFANDLIAHSLAAWEDDHGPWRLLDPPSDAELEHEGRELVEPALPQVQEKLWDDLLLGEIWERVLEDRARRMLFRMTLLRRPWGPEMNNVLGEPGEAEEKARETAERLRRTSLLEQVELWSAAGDGQGARVRHFTLHPATAHFIGERFGADEEIRRTAHARVGEYLEAQARPWTETDIEAGHHLLLGGESARALELLGSASDRLRGHGRVREALQILEPFLDEPVLRALRRELAGQLLGTVGLAYTRLGEVEKAIGYYDQALVIAHEIGHRRNEGDWLGSLGSAYTNLGEVGKAIGYYDQALIVSREIGHRRNEGNWLGSLGIAYRDLGEVEKAIGYHEQALVIAREIGHRRGEGNQMGNLGLAYDRLGEVEKAIGYHEQALAIDREIGHRRGEGRTLGNLGNAYADRGEVEKAIGYYEQAFAIAREIGDRRNEG
ncbi:MAG: tetratricopeptide repeat protein, partial [bacterium]|nr:tetratricopeptide repeat protein [bacterium]